ncbi:MAG: PorT family protein [Bacteroidia bacterium]|nr:PorT family protein [Bacteroidia bacterium]
MKHLLTYFLLTGLIHAAFSQNSETDTTFTRILQKGKVLIGLNIGLNQSNIDGKEITYIFHSKNTDWLHGWNMGISFKHQFNQYFYTLHEIIYTQKGSRVQLYDTIHQAYSSTLRMHYIDFYPINFGIEFKSVSIQIGGYLSALVDASIQQKDINGNYYTSHKIYANPANFVEKEKYLQKFDYGWNAGVMIHIWKFSCNMKYLMGFNDIFQYANSRTNNDLKTTSIQIYNKTLLFSLIYFIN